MSGMKMASNGLLGCCVCWCLVVVHTACRADDQSQHVLTFSSALRKLLPPPCDAATLSFGALSTGGSAPVLLSPVLLRVRDSSVASPCCRTRAHRAASGACRLVIAAAPGEQACKTFVAAPVQSRRS
jgi:hypothetical protein